MKQKGLSLLLILGMVFVFAGVSLANIPAPPVNQIAGFDDTEFNFLTEDDCRACHPTTSDAHHLLYGSDMIGPGSCSAVTGTCSVAGTDCVVDTDCPAGETCVENDDTCTINDDCATYTNICTRGEPCGSCDVSGDECGVDEDCPAGETCLNPCPRYRGVQGQCGQPVCSGGSMAPNNPNAGVYGCLTCHNETNVGGVIGFEVERDCMVCHQYRGGATVHHLDSSVTGAKAGICNTCHGDIVDNIVGCDPGVLGNCSDTNLTCAADSDCKSGNCSLTTNEPCFDDSDCALLGECSVSGDACDVDADCVAPETCIGGGETCVGGGTTTCNIVPCDHEIPTYNPSLVTPHPAGGYGEEVGTCDYCHAPGLDAASGVEVHDNHDTHHHAGIQYFADGSRFDACFWCHQEGRPGRGDPGTEIRTCENCHGYESLHNIQVDSDTMCVYDPNNPGDCNIVVGGEEAGYGHVGKDDPGVESDCWGCHGFSTASAPAAGPIVPTLIAASATSITAGVETAITLNGCAFTNDEFTSVVEITGAGGSVVVAPATISVGLLTATIPALDAGSYEIRVKKEDVVSNPIGISSIPGVVITSATCADGVLTIAGVGFGDAPPAGADQYINVKLGGEIAETLSWTNTQITVDGCADAVTVNALYGSASTGATACTGNFDGDADVDGSDASDFKADFGRNAISNPCSAGSLCNGDFDCDGDVDGSDAAGIKADFGRSAFNNACAEETAADCSY